MRCRKRNRKGADTDSQGESVLALLVGVRIIGKDVNILGKIHVTSLSGFAVIPWLLRLRGDSGTRPEISRKQRMWLHRDSDQLSLDDEIAFTDPRQSIRVGRDSEVDRKRASIRVSSTFRLALMCPTNSHKLDQLDNPLLLSKSGNL